VCRAYKTQNTICAIMQKFYAILFCFFELYRIYIYTTKKKALIFKKMSELNFEIKGEFEMMIIIPEKGIMLN
jgi:hypothetical protein